MSANDFFMQFGLSAKINLLSFIAGCVIIFFMPNTKQLADTFTPAWTRLLPLAIAIGLSVALMGKASQFLYFQF